MKKSTRILAVSLALCLGLGTAALAAGGTRTIEVLTGMKVLVNGEEFTPTDVNGSPVDVFAYNGTTYVPIRAMSEAFGLEVGYDAARQAAVVSGSAGSSAAAPDTRDVIYICSHGPEEITMEDGTVQTFYNEIYEELRWQLEDPDMGFEAEIVSGTLPAGITYNEADQMFEGRFEAVETQDVVVRFTPDEGDAFERIYRFVINETSAFNAAPVVIWGVEGDQVESYISSAYSGILYTGDDLTDDPADPVSYGMGASSPIGTQAALDALAEYGLTLRHETRTDDGEWYWADNFVSGTLEGSTDGWVKLSVPVYAGMGNDSRRVEDGELQPGSWWVTGEGDAAKIIYGNVDIYLNIIPLGD